MGWEADAEDRRRVGAMEAEQPAGYVLPLRGSEAAAGGWTSAVWLFPRGRLFFLPGDAPIGLRLPLASLPTVDDGADAVMQLAASPALAATTGRYFNQLTEARSRVEQAYDAAARARLKALSRELTGVG